MAQWAKVNTVATLVGLVGWEATLVEPAEWDEAMEWDEVKLKRKFAFWKIVCKN